MTTLKQRIKDEMKAALLSGDRFVGDTLRNLGAAILDEEVKQGVRETGLDDAAVEQFGWDGVAAVFQFQRGVPFRADADFFHGTASAVYCAQAVRQRKKQRG